MGIAKIVVLFVALAIGNLLYSHLKTEPVLDLPETWWGPEGLAEDTKIVPFEIKVSEDVLKDLKNRLEKARPFTPPLEGVQQQYGMNSNLLAEIRDFWLTKYSWREREKFLNQFPQYKTQIQGLKIHFLHVKPKSVPTGTKIVPLLLLHGWPGSVREFYEAIPLLSTPQKDRNFVFELVIPSLPGYGFSDAAIRPGLGPRQMGVIFKNLMTRLGHPKFYVQGGDWGSEIATFMGVHFPEHVKGIHLNMCSSRKPISMVKWVLGSFWPSFLVSKDKEHKLYPMSGFLETLMLEFGYAHIQATKPDTIGVAMNDSPIGLAAYILEKFTTWTNPEWKNLEDGGLTKKFTLTQLLDNVMIYWITSSITTSFRLYAETTYKAEMANAQTIVVPVKTACALFEHEVFYHPPSMLKDTFPNLVQTNEYEGGHFAAFERPELLAKDVWLAIEQFETVAPDTSTSK